MMKRFRSQKLNNKAFTIVELLIVVVVIAILATISIVAYNGIQQRSRDSERKSELSALSKAIELYYVDHDEYPHCGTNNVNNSGGCSVNGIADKLVPQYIDSLPEDPVNIAGSGTAPYSPNLTYRYARGWPPINHYQHTNDNSRGSYSLGTYMEASGCDNGCSTNWGHGFINYVIGTSN